MIFWVSVVIGLCVFLGIIYFIFDTADPYTILGKIVSGVIGAALAAFVGGFVIVAIVGTANIMMPKMTVFKGETETQLRAIGTGDGIEGQFYLGSGYVGSERKINYIYEEKDGGIRLGSQPAAEIVIYERADAKPVMITKHYAESNLWLMPDSFFGTINKHEFVVPEGSILETTKIDVE